MLRNIRIRFKNFAIYNLCVYVEFSFSLLATAISISQEHTLNPMCHKVGEVRCCCCETMSVRFD